MRRRIDESRQLRFIIAGSFNTGLDFLMLNLLTMVAGLHDIVANTISVCIGITISYVLNHYFVFRYPFHISLLKFGEFFAITGFSSLILQNAVIWGFEYLFAQPFGRSLLSVVAADGRHFVALNIAKVTAVGLGLIWNYTFYRLLVFRQPKKANAPS